MRDADPPRRYLDFAVQISPSGGGRFTAQVVQTPNADGGSTSFEFGLEEAELTALEQRVRGSAATPARGSEPRSQERRDPLEIGRNLFAGLFSGQVGNCYQRSLGRLAGESDLGLRLRLSFDLNESAETRKAAALPWELIFNPDLREFVARNPLSPVVRFLTVGRPVKVPPFTPPLRILGVLANPKGTPRLNLAAEKRRSKVAWDKVPGVEIDFVEDGQISTLHRRLHDTPFHVLHFMGHGAIDEGDGEGFLLFETAAGESHPVPGAVLADALKGASSLRMVLLNACDTAALPRREGLDPFTGVATALVLAGVPAVIAMQFPISDSAALAFSSALYERLAQDAPLEAAVTFGRNAVTQSAPTSLEWATPVLFLRTPPDIVEGIIPGSRRMPEIRRHIFDSSFYVEEKTREFLGRQFAFEQLASFVRERDRGYFFLIGEPGIGKTALVAHLIRKDQHVHHFNRRRDGVVQPAAFLENVCAQLIARHGLGYSSLPSEATRNNSFLATLLAQVAARLDPGRKEVIVVDALDESETDGLPSGANPLFLPDSLPAGIFFVVTSRPKTDLPRTSGEPGELMLEGSSSQNIADVREYLGCHLGRSGIRHFVARQGLSEGSFVDLLTEKSEGNFMYLRHVLPAIDRGAYQDCSLAALPKGLADYYDDHWQRMRQLYQVDWLEAALPVLAVLTVARAPLPFEVVAQFSQVSGRPRVRTVLEQWRPFLHLQEEEDAEGRFEKLYSLYHTSFFDFMRRKDMVADQGLDLKLTEQRILDALVAYYLERRKKRPASELTRRPAAVGARASAPRTEEPGCPGGG